MKQCPACEKFVDPINHPEQIYAVASGILYHHKDYCERISSIPARLKTYGRSGKSRKKRQENVVYY